MLTKRQRPPAVEPIGEHAADEREEHDRELLEKSVEAEENAEPVSERMSQFCAVSCVQVPTLDVQAPIHWTRKSRWVKAASIRRRVREPNIVAGAAMASAGGIC